MSVREDVLASAVKFLQDPKVQSSPLARRIAFLESKGLTSEEIEQAMQRASGGASTTGAVVSTAPGAMQSMMPGGQPMYGQPMYLGPPMQPPPPPPKERDWKDYFIATTIAFGIGYGIYQFAKVFFFCPLS
jgi:peroxin-14